MVDCGDYRLAMRLQALRRRQKEEDLDKEEKEEIRKEIRILEECFENS